MFFYPIAYRTLLHSFLIRPSRSMQRTSMLLKLHLSYLRMKAKLFHLIHSLTTLNLVLHWQQPHWFLTCRFPHVPYWKDTWSFFNTTHTISLYPRRFCSYSYTDKKVQLNVDECMCAGVRLLVLVVALFSVKCRWMYVWWSQVACCCFVLYCSELLENRQDTIV